MFSLFFYIFATYFKIQMTKKISYKPLIHKWELFLETNHGDSLENFAMYILQEAERLKKESTEKDFKLPEKTFEYPYLTAEAGRVIFRLYKFSKIYSRPIMMGVGLNSFDEFSILTTLLEKKEATKKYLIEENLIELTTGIDMLKRMLKQDFLKERVNPKDKREKLVSMSDNGQKVLFTILKDFQSMEDVLGDLNKEEREQTIQYLERLDSYHSSLNQKNA